ncbi:MAG TPA: PepSY domain-containing protein [Firmicutes bacterium]|nr:PepSY domain-containing protein [Bacillota bacterium]
MNRKEENREIERRLAEEVRAAAPDVMEEVLAGSRAAGPADEEVTAKITAIPRRRRPWKALAAAAAAVALVAGGTAFAYHRISNGVDSIVQLDVNPSIEMKVSRSEKVLSAQALNDDAEAILGDMDLEGASLDVAMNALIGSMLRNGYIDELANSILITVENKDAAKGEALQERLTTEVEQLLQAGQVNGAVLGQTTSADEELSQLARQYGISVGKAALVRQLVAADSLLDFASLAKLPINDLNLLAFSRQIALDGVSSTGQASSGAYIGESRAKEIAFQRAGATDATAANLEIELDCDDGVMLYEVEFVVGNYKYEYDVDATTGDIRKEERDARPSQPSSGDSSGGTTATTPTGGTGGSGTQTTGGSGRLTVDQALNAALAHAGVSAQSAYDKSVEFDYDHGVAVYEVEFRSGTVEYEYEIDAATGEVRAWKSEEDDRPASTVTGQEIGMDKAKELALERAGVSGDVRFQKEKREYDDGRLIYELEFRANGMEYECEIDAVSGAILDWESEWDD